MSLRTSFRDRGKLMSATTSIYQVSRKPLHLISIIMERIKNASTNFYDNIAKSNLALFKSKLRKTSSKSQVKMLGMKSDVQLFSRMYIASQARDLDTFFEHECHPWPPALAEGINTMHLPIGKADLLPCLE